MFSICDDISNKEFCDVGGINVDNVCDTSVDDDVDVINDDVGNTGVVDDICIDPSMVPIYNFFLVPTILI